MERYLLRQGSKTRVRAMSSATRSVSKMAPATRHLSQPASGAPQKALGTPTAQSTAQAAAAPLPSHYQGGSITSAQPPTPPAAASLQVSPQPPQKPPALFWRIQERGGPHSDQGSAGEENSDWESSPPFADYRRLAIEVATRIGPPRDHSASFLKPTPGTNFCSYYSPR